MLYSKCVFEKDRENAVNIILIIYMIVQVHSAFTRRERFRQRQKYLAGCVRLAAAEIRYLCVVGSVCVTGD